MPPGLDWRAQCAVQDIIAWVRGNFQKLLSKGVGCTFLRTLSDYVFTGILVSVGPPGAMLFLFCVFTGILFSVGPPGAMLFCFSFLPAALGNWRPPVAPSFVARRKIGEKGVPRGCGPLNPRGNVLEDSDVLCANRLATVRVTRLRRLRRSAYPLASACCAAQKNSKTYATTQLPTIN